MHVKLTRETLRGVWPALIIPWNEQGDLRENFLAEEVRDYAEKGAHGVYTGGTTGEFYAQSDADFARITHVVCEAARESGIPVQIGCTGLSTRTAVQRIRVALAEGANGIQVALPFWLELKDDEVRSFLGACASAAGEVPLILYHTGRSKRKLTPTVLGALAMEFPSLIGIKDTACSVEELRAMLIEVPGLSVFGGEHDLIAKMKAGGAGTYSSLTGFNTALIVRFYHSCIRGDWNEAGHWHALIQRLFHEQLLPLFKEDGLMDSAIDRVLREAGGRKVGVHCQGPYRSATRDHVEKLRAWCAKNAAEWLEA